MGTFRRHDCPYLVKGHSMCKYKMDKIKDRTDLTYNQKLFYMQISTCSGCEIYKKLKNAEKGERRKSMKNITITKNSTVKAIGQARNGNSKPVFCISTGEIYTSAIDAAKEIGVSQSVLCLAASGKIRTCKGKRYCYVKDIIPNLNEISETARVRAEKVAEYDKIVGKQQRKAELEARKSKLVIMQAKMEKEAMLIAQEEAALSEV